MPNASLWYATEAFRATYAILAPRKHGVKIAPEKNFAENTKRGKMKRLIATLNDGLTANIAADKIETQDNFFIAKDDNGEIVAAFDYSAVVCIYLSEPKQ